MYSTRNFNEDTRDRTYFQTLWYQTDDDGPKTRCKSVRKSYTPCKDLSSVDFFFFLSHRTYDKIFDTRFPRAVFWNLREKNYSITFKSLRFEPAGFSRIACIPTQTQTLLKVRLCVPACCTAVWVKNRSACNPYTVQLAYGRCGGMTCYMWDIYE